VAYFAELRKDGKADDLRVLDTLTQVGVVDPGRRLEFEAHLALEHRGQGGS
jgi:hypothetical protein